MALFASTTGGIFGVLVLSFFSPQLAKVAISFSAQEYFAFALLGLTIIVSLGDSMLKAIISGLLGLLLATVGIDKLTTAERFTFGIKQIMGGFEFVSLIIGIFAVGEVLERFQAQEQGTLTTKEKVQTKLPSLKEVLECKWTLLRSYIIGTIIGILPGVGATTASFFGYSEAVRFSTTPEKFGTGILEGMYWSLLHTPTAGVTYGGHGVWGWDDGTRPPTDHPGTGLPMAWQRALTIPGAVQMTHLARSFTSIEFGRLRPAPEAVATQPGRDEPRRFIAAARTDERDLLVRYVPEDRAVDVNAGMLPPASQASWFNPRTGETSTAVGEEAAGALRFRTPSEGDGILQFVARGRRAGEEGRR